MGRFVLGIDVGGTNIKLGLVNPSGKVLSRTNLSTTSFIHGQNTLIDAIVDAGHDLLKENRLKQKDILGIGMGLPGLVDMKRGLVQCLVNIPGWKNVALKKIMEKKTGLPTYVDNDVNVIALGEWKFGAGRGTQNMVCLTLGTGVGGGLIINSELYRGEGFCAGELGHIPLNEIGPSCNCGGRACLERYIGNKYLLARARKNFKDKKISLEKITQLAARHDKRALLFWRETAVHLGHGLVSVVNILNPARIVIGGGISNAYKYLFPAIQETLLNRAMKIPARFVKIVKAKLGSDAGIIGTQVLVTHAITSNSK